MFCRSSTPPRAAGVPTRIKMSRPAVRKRLEVLYLTASELSQFVVLGVQCLNLGLQALVLGEKRENVAGAAHWPLAIHKSARRCPSDNASGHRASEARNARCQA